MEGIGKHDAHIYPMVPIICACPLFSRRTRPTVCAQPRVAKNNVERGSRGRWGCHGSHEGG